jgi:endonuclease III
MAGRRASQNGSTDGGRMRLIERRLRLEYGRPRHFNPTDPLDDLIFLVLSRMTQEVKYVRTYARLRSSLSTWGAVREAPPDQLEELIHEAGLAPTKTAQLQAILAEIDAREGAMSLHRLRSMVDEDVERYLTTLPGVARKTALCVMLYTLDRDVLPVDTHVWRVAQRLGLAPAGGWSEAQGRRLEARVPPGLRASLHVTLVAHGREVCRAPRPDCGGCMLTDLCPTAGS